MKHLRLVAMAILCALLGACAGVDTRPAEPPIPALVTTTAHARTDDHAVRRHREILADVSRGRHGIAFLGASIIEGFPTTGAERWNAVWRPRHSVNCGISGDRTENVLFRLDDGLLEALAAPNNRIRFVVMNVGSNNTDVNSASEIAEGVRAIVARLRQRIPNAIIIVTLFPRSQWPDERRDKLQRAQAILAEHYAAHAPERVTVLDMWPVFLAPSGELPAEIMPDFLHPSPAGYRLWSEQLERIIIAHK